MTFFWPAAGAEKFWGICTKIGGPPYDGGGSDAKPAHTHVWIRALSAHPPLWVTSIGSPPHSKTQWSGWSG